MLYLKYYQNDITDISHSTHLIVIANLWLLSTNLVVALRKLNLEKEHKTCGICTPHTPIECERYRAKERTLTFPVRNTHPGIRYQQNPAFQICQEFTFPYNNNNHMTPNSSLHLSCLFLSALSCKAPAWMCMSASWFSRFSWCSGAVRRLICLRHFFEMRENFNPESWIRCFGGNREAISRVLWRNRRSISKMPGSRSKSEKQEAEKQLRRDPYEVLGLNRNSTDQEIKSAYRKLALKYAHLPFYPYSFIFYQLLSSEALLDFAYFFFDEFELVASVIFEANLYLISWIWAVADVIENISCEIGCTDSCF